MDDIMKTIKSLEESGLLMKRVSETIKIKARKQKCGFIAVSLHTLGASLLGNMLARKEAITTKAIKAG